jgi:hypothetical protein
MTEPMPTERKPRRKWGWIFVVLFVVHAITFAIIIANDFQKLRRAEMNSLRLPASIAAASQERELREETNQTMIYAGLLSVVTLVAAYVGFRPRIS